MERAGGPAMKAVLLAAGKGQRLGDKVLVIPKPLLPVGGDTMFCNMARAYD